MAQNYTEFSNTDTLSISHIKMIDNYKTFRSLNAGVSFPSTLLYDGTPCWRTDLNTLYIYDGVGEWVATATGINTGDQTITLTGDVTGSGTGSFATVVGNDSHTHTTSTITNLSGVNTGDETKIRIDALNVDADTVDGQHASEFVNNTDIGVSVEAYDATILKDVDIGSTVQQHMTIVSQADAEAGVATSERSWTAQRVKQAVSANAPAPSDTYGAVGTYALLLHHTSGQLLYGGTSYPGSSLTPVAFSTHNTTTNTSGNVVIDAWGGKAFVSGTWRCMGQRSVNGVYEYAGTLFKRIS